MGMPDRPDRRLLLLLDTLPHGVQENDCDGVITYTNRAHDDILGWEPGELLGRHIWEALPSQDDQDAFQEYLARLVREQPAPVPFRGKNRRKDGSLVDLQVDWDYVRDADGVLQGFISVTTDISDRKRGEDLLLARTNGLASLLDVSKRLAGTLDILGVLQAAVEGVTALSGLDTAAVYLLQGRMLLLQATTPPLPPGFPNQLRAARLEDHPHIREAMTAGKPLLLPDITAAVLTAAERSVAEQRNLRTVLYIPLVADARPRGAFIVGSVREPAPISEAEIDLAGTLANLSALAVRNAQLYDEGRRHAAQLELALAERVQAEKVRKNLQMQLVQAQKLESIGRLAGGVAHDFNNMLGVILGHVELALQALGGRDPLRHHLEQILEAAQRSESLTRQMLAFARRQTIAPRLLDLNTVIADMLGMLRRMIGEDIDLAWIPGRDLGRVRMDPAQVDQVLVNLCVNARDAIDGVGKVTIETNNTTFDQVYSDAHPGFLPGAYVMVAVSDDGAGMSEETRSRIFEPFFSTKEEGRGTGLGLATVYGIVKQNEGFVHVYSEPGQGTTFKIYLRRHHAGPEVVHDAAVDHGMLGGTETILLVEDEVMMLDLTREMLEALGYRVLSAGGASEALRLAGEHAGTIDLLVTDVVMPGMNGAELAGQVQALSPGARTLYVSGYTANVIAHQGILRDDIKFLAKPFSKQDLASRVRDALSTGAEP